ncbi:MAG: hypothetical protein ACLVL2_01065 [Bacteroides cellulosilyticus]
MAFVISSNPGSTQRLEEKKSVREILEDINTEDQSSIDVRAIPQIEKLVT